MKKRIIYPDRYALLIPVMLMSLIMNLHGQQNTFSFQGILQENDEVIANGTYDIHFALYNQAEGGEPLWQESHEAVTVENGLVSIKLGSVTDLSTLDFNTNYYLGIAIDDGEELAPRTPLSSVAYSQYALNIDPNAIENGSLELTKINTDDAEAGDAMIFDGKSLIWAPPQQKENSLSIPMTAFKPENSTYDYDIFYDITVIKGGGTNYHGIQLNTSGNGTISCPVYLPDGATINEVSLFLTKKTGSIKTSLNIDARLYRIDLENFGVIPIGDINTSTLATKIKESITSFDNAIVDNDNYAYQLSVDLDSWSNAKVQGAVISYTLPQ